MDDAAAEGYRLRRQRAWRLVLVALLLLAGGAISLWGPWEIADVVALGRAMAEHPWLLVVIVLVQATLFALALPGSLAFWVVAPFYPPWWSTLALTLGSTLGALGAYGLSRLLGGGVVSIEGRWVRLLGRHSDLLSQCALRALPGFPHAPINYAAGLLRLPLLPFALAALVGLGLKSGIYSFAIYEAVEAAEAGQVDRGAVVVLFLLFLLFAAGALLRYWLRGAAGGNDRES
ncbi:hypothetical protein CKO15_05145 [Halorhodospira abdelmalekii]|uniref:TVP38/TMEM64 family protein n=1 Tax=Halorhodospira abdelmalekii TaxID=421629 RepID=UPI001907F647|nr:VTT domain-containing protein [Halorhodospira abdelmalekii]MBK1734682.1 hypothetical protein [Halorhodospira abdelmalekii]